MKNRIIVAIILITSISLPAYADNPQKNNGWGKINEIIVDKSSPRRIYAIDLDTGRTLDIQIEKKMNAKKFFDKLLTEDVDLYPSVKSLSCHGLNWIPITNADWLTRSPKSLLNSRAWQMALENKLLSYPQRSGNGSRPMHLDISLPTAFMFQTRQGSIGLAQVSGALDESEPLKIQYKLTTQKHPIPNRLPLSGTRESSRNLRQFAHACLKFAFQNDNMLPTSIDQLTDDFATEAQWAKDNAVYLGNGRDITKIKDFSQFILAYDKIFLEKFDSTKFVLLNMGTNQIFHRELNAVINDNKPVPSFVPATENVHTAKNNIAQLPNGITVELLQIIDEEASGDVEFFSPDGTEMRTALINHNSGNIRRKPFEEDLRTYKFIARTTGPSIDTRSGWIHKQFDNAIYNFSENATVGNKRDYEVGLTNIIAAFPKNLRETNVRIALAAEPWQTIGTATELGSYEAEDYVVVIFPPMPPHGSSQPKDGLLVSFSKDVSNMDFRVIAIDKDGKEYVPHTHYPNSHFQDLRYDQLKEFRFQTRQYHWAEFKNVALTPNGKKDVETEKEMVKSLLGIRFPGPVTNWKSDYFSTDIGDSCQKIRFDIRKEHLIAALDNAPKISFKYSDLKQNQELVEKVCMIGPVKNKLEFWQQQNQTHIICASQSEGQWSGHMIYVGIETLDDDNVRVYFMYSTWAY